MSPPTLKCYYDRENGEVHYLTSAYFDNGNGNYGSVNEDMKLVNGSVTCGIYSAISVQETVDQDTYEYSYEYEYYGAGDSKISESDFYDMFVTYPEGFSTRDVNLGFLRRYYSQDMYLKDLDDVALKNALYDSYCVFNGTVDPYEYEDMYNLPEAGYIEPDLYSASIGKWTLYSSEVEGDVNYYDWDSPRIITMDIYDDYSVYIHNYEYGTVDSNYSSHLEEINTYPIFWVDMMKEIGKVDEYGVEEYSYEIVAVYTEEGNAFMEIAFDGWDKWGDWVVGSHLTFIREDY
jgi:hypothetical protein